MKRLLAFGTYDRHQHPRVGVLIDGMRERGWNVSELNRPLGLSTAQRVSLLRCPWKLPGFAARVGLRWMSLVRGSLRYRGRRRPDAILVGYLGHFDVLLARMLFPRTPIVLDHLIFAAGTAQDRGESGRLKLTVLRALDQCATGAADVVVVDTAEHGARLSSALRARGVVVPVGAQKAWYDAGEGRQDRVDQRPDEKNTLSVVFFGLFTPLQGTPTIARALLRLHRSDVRVDATLIGTGQDLEECQRILSDVDTVTWMPWVDAAELPGVVASHDVCLGIVGTTPKALDVVPNKVYQGLAAGCAVVTSETPPQRRILGESALMVTPGDDKALAEVLHRLADNREFLGAAQRAALYGRTRFVPGEVVAPLEERLEQELAR